MATSPIPSWAREQSPTYTGPTAATALALFAVVALVLLALLSGPQAQGQGAPDTTVPACARHFPPTCPEGR